jgi:hypothetical protein
LLGAQKISPSSLKKLKTFLFVPSHGEALVQWGNGKFSTRHTVTSAIERIEHLENAECSHFCIKVREHTKWLLALLFCLVILKMFT